MNSLEEIRANGNSLNDEERGIRRVWDKKLKKFVEPEEKSSPHKLKHYIFPAGGLEKLAAQKKDPTLAVLLRIFQPRFINYQQNPVKLAKVELFGFKVSKNQKARALVILEESGLISVQRSPRKSPLVTLDWKLTKGKFS